MDRARRYGRPGAVVLALLLGLLGAGFWAYTHTERTLITERRVAGEAKLALYGELLRGWLGKYRALPSIYAHEPDVIALLRGQDDPARVEAVNARLERWNAASGASDTYILDAQGLTVAASNWDSSTSFIGKAYAFRPYFKQALQGVLGRTFALGTVSEMRGYYFGYPVLHDGAIIGAVVVKTGVDDIEQELRLDTGGVFVSDRHGVVILAGPPHWRMKTIAPLSPEALARIERDRLFPTEILRPLPISGLDKGNDTVQVMAKPDRSDDAEETFLHLSQPLTSERWRVHLLVETKGIGWQSLIAALMTGLAILTVFLGGLLLWQRRRRMIGLLAAREETQRELEHIVSDRTANLREINLQLERQVRERLQAEEELRRTQSELVQAGKLAALGQMSAALSHEFNQPLAAIRTYADNAVAFLDRGRQEQTSENLARISRLTERMARLSKHLTSFARKPKDTVEPVSLDAVMAETLALLHARIEGAGAEVAVTLPPRLIVRGGQTRLQHVFMNLIGNALDATATEAAPIITVHATRHPDTIRICVEDNGPGIDPAVLPDIFDPFFSTKGPGKGLGLGLSISYNIVHDFDGLLDVENRETGGARFIVTLRRGNAAMQEAAE